VLYINSGDEVNNISNGNNCGERGKVYTGYWWGNLGERSHLEDPDLDGMIILRWVFRKWYVGTWTGSIWLRIGTGGGHLLMR